jgi:Aromatic acid exporter family member 1
MRQDQDGDYLDRPAPNGGADVVDARVMREKLRARLRDPIFWNDVVQLLKTALAAIIAWVVARTVLGLSQPFLAPWAALLVVHATVFRSFSRGAMQVAATFAAVLLAAVIGQLLGMDTWAVVVLLVVGLIMGAVPWMGADTTTIASTAVVVLTTGYADELLFSRLIDTAIGVTVGLVVNFMVWPPLRRRTTISAIDMIDDAIGGLLIDMGTTMSSGCGPDDINEWIERTRDLDGNLDHAWSMVRQATESAWLNPRRPAHELRDPKEWHQLLRRMEQTIAEIRSMARTLDAHVVRRNTWQSPFAVPWTNLLADTGRAVVDADPQALRALHDRLRRLAQQVSALDELVEQWPLYGALIINLRNILDAMSEVAMANPMGQPSVPLARLRPHARSH